MMTPKNVITCILICGVIAFAIWIGTEIYEDSQKPPVPVEYHTKVVEWGSSDIDPDDYVFCYIVWGKSPTGGSIYDEYFIPVTRITTKYMFLNLRAGESYTFKKQYVDSFGNTIYHPQIFVYQTPEHTGTK